MSARTRARLLLVATLTIIGTRHMNANGSDSSSAAPVAFSGLEQYGVQALPATSSEGSRLLSLKGETDMPSELLPFSIIIKNSSGRDIVAVLVRYEITTPPIPLTENYFYHSLDPQLPPIIPAGSSILITPSHAVNMNFLRTHSTGSSALANTTRAKIMQRLVLLHKASAVHIAIDSVAFKDGKIAGPDKAGTRERINRSAEAYRNLRDDLMRRVTRGESDQSLIAMLQKKQSVPVMKNPRTRRLDDYVETQKRWATHYLNILSSGRHDDFIKLLMNGTPEGHLYPEFTVE